MNPVIEKLHQILSPDDTDASSTETNTAIKNHPDKVVERHYTADRTHSKPSILDKNGMSSREFKRNNPVPDESHTHMLKSPSPARRDGTVELKKRERKILTTPTIEVVDDDDSRRDGGVDSNKNTRTSEESIPRRKAIVIVTSRLTKKQMVRKLLFVSFTTFFNTFAP